MMFFDCCFLFITRLFIKTSLLADIGHPTYRLCGREKPMERVSGRRAIADGRFDPLNRLAPFEISHVSQTRLISAAT
jgi:hypothetical protein